MWWPFEAKAMFRSVRQGRSAMSGHSWYNYMPAFQIGSATVINAAVVSTTTPTRAA